MSPFVLVVTVLAGGVGALARWRCDLAVRAVLARLVRRVGRGGAGAQPPVHPLLGIATVNVLGSFLAGLGWSLAAAGVMSGAVWSVAGTGFLGGFTTFSTAVLDVSHLAREGRPRAAVALLVGVYVVALVACAAGVAVGASAGA